MDFTISIGETSALQGISVETIRRWESLGNITSTRTQGVDIKPGLTIAYARVSSHDQKADLETQTLVI